MLGIVKYGFTFRLFDRRNGLSAYRIYLEQQQHQKTNAKTLTAFIEEQRRWMEVLDTQRDIVTGFFEQRDSLVVTVTFQTDPIYL